MPTSQNVEQTQAIRRLLRTICLSVFGHVVVLALKGVFFFQSSQEKNCVRIYFSLNLLALRLQLYLKKYFGTSFSCEFCKIFKYTLFIKYLWVAASGNSEIKSHSGNFRRKSEDCGVVNLFGDYVYFLGDFRFEVISMINLKNIF